MCLFAIRKLVHNFYLILFEHKMWQTLIESLNCFKSHLSKCSITNKISDAHRQGLVRALPAEDSRAFKCHVASVYWWMQKALLGYTGEGTDCRVNLRSVLLYFFIVFFCFSFFLLKNIVYINFLKGLYVMWWVQNKYLI